MSSYEYDVQAAGIAGHRQSDRDAGRNSNQNADTARVNDRIQKNGLMQEVLTEILQNQATVPLYWTIRPAFDLW